MMSHIGHDNRSIAYPGIATDGDVGIDASLFANGNVEPGDSMLFAPIQNRDVRADEDVVFERHIAERAVKAHVNAASDSRCRMGQRRPETDATVGITLGQ